ncbi:MAG: DUF3611 family protein [Okeania sp. SIO2G4]|uniref:DUF3611 family protein n=1 Tax=unclassified Okeania TaxID=2634635 RepID=UPI0013B7ED82|nr:MULTISPECIES: DUF3611 family protein [unclassified Okeania]NEP71760.1 DUF3611 family protein [Okeania sp. SIO2G5]NEP92468.1 DUF3611 family protein [Okeania sp. SIO2F5]NEQ90460.1 DUF3611 family protein [Okeania sp. SIO2G4]
MSNLSDLPTAVKQVANALRFGGWTCFWSQLALGVISGFMFLFAAFILPNQMDEAGAGGSLFFPICGLVVLGFSIFLSFRYTRLARKLRAPTDSSRPSRADTTQQVKRTLITNLVGITLTLLGAEAIGGILLGESLVMGASMFNSTELEKFTPDIIILLGNTHIIVAHFIGIVVGLFLLDRVYK